LYEYAVCKTLMKWVKLRPLVNFIIILCATFSIEFAAFLQHIQTCLQRSLSGT